MTTFEAARMSARAARLAMAEAQKVMGESMKDAIVLGLGDIFEKYPFLGGVTWTQYTPYFNDGDACVFTAHTDYPTCLTVGDVSNEDFDEDETEFYRLANEWDYQEVPGTDYRTPWSQRTVKVPNADHDPAYVACEKEVVSFFEALRDGDSRSYNDPTPSTFDMALLRAFGDHVRVTILRDGTLDGEYYDHE